MPGESDDLKKRLLATHPWYDEMCSIEGWPTMRAVLGELRKPEEKRRFLVRGGFEKEQHFTTRVELTQFLGVTEPASGSMCGAIFREEPDVDYDGATELQKWADTDVDRDGTSLVAFLKQNALEAAVMGGIGILVDKPPREVDPQNRQEEEALGLRQPFLRTWRVEEIRDWDVGDDGRPLWVKLMRTHSELGDAVEGSRRFFVEWQIWDRMKFRVYRAPIESQHGFEVERQRDGNGLPLIREATELGDVEEVTPANAEHGAGLVPFEFLTGERISALCGKSIFAATARADISAFNRQSQLDLATYLHAVPLFWIKTKSKIAEVVKNIATALKLNPEEKEDVGYATAPSDAFGELAQQVEGRKLEGYRQASADPGGLFDGRVTPESGRAKSIRAANSEGRVLCDLASSIKRAHEGILEIAARRLASATSPPDERVFTGSARYPKRFDLADPQEVIDQYNDAKHDIDSPAWHRLMQKRIALLTAGDVSKDDKAKITEELDNISDEEIVHAVDSLDVEVRQDAVGTEELGDVRGVR